MWHIIVIILGSVQNTPFCSCWLYRTKVFKADSKHILQKDHWQRLHIKDRCDQWVEAWANENVPECRKPLKACRCSLHNSFIHFPYLLQPYSGLWRAAGVHPRPTLECSSGTHLRQQFKKRNLFIFKLQYFILLLQVLAFILSQHATA